MHGDRRYNISGDVFYRRTPNPQKEKFNEIEQRYFSPEERKGLTVKVLKALREKKESTHYMIDEMETVIRENAREKIANYAVLLEGFIDMYKESKTADAKKVNLLNDMITFSQISRLKEPRSQEIVREEEPEIYD